MKFNDFVFLRGIGFGRLSVRTKPLEILELKHRHSAREPVVHPPVRVYMHSLTSVYASRPASPSSHPLRLCFTPPSGIFGSLSLLLSIQTLLDSISAVKWLAHNITSRDSSSETIFTVIALFFALSTI
jgi:hypothetical protein